MKRFLVIAVVAGIATPALAAKSIIGKWGSDGEACAFGATQIERMSISSPELRCRFDAVSRSGDAVTWRGSCDRAFGSRVPDAVVTARSYDDGDYERIAVRVNSGTEHEYVRCR